MPKNLFLAPLFLASFLSFGFSAQTIERCTMGEARGESVEGMLAIISALNNRASTRQVFGCTKEIKNLSLEEKANFRSALRLSASNPDSVSGATVWGNASDLKIFKRQKWFRNCVFVKRIGGHFFFRELKPSGKKLHKSTKKFDKKSLKKHTHKTPKKGKRHARKSK